MFYLVPCPSPYGKTKKRTLNVKNSTGKMDFFVNAEVFIYANGCFKHQKITFIKNHLNMKKVKPQQNVKLNLTLDRSFYQVLQKRAKQDYVATATWAKQYLMRHLLDKNNSDSKCLTQNGINMGL